jgi:Mor family transcriptional regulator
LYCASSKTAIKHVIKLYTYNKSAHLYCASSKTAIKHVIKLYTYNNKSGLSYANIFKKYRIYEKIIIDRMKDF